MITKWFFFDLGILSCPHVLTHPFVFTRVMNVVMIGNGQVTQGVEIIKPNVRKVYKLGANVIGGSASSLATMLLLIQQVGIVILN